LAQFERDSGNRSGELRYLIECNRIDPFHRELHVRMGEAQEALGKPAAAAVEFEVAAAVTPQQDRRYSRRGAEPPDAAADLQQRAELWLRAARARRVAGDTEQALNLLDRIVREAAATDVAETAKGLQQEWRGK
jgi:tetratricopeptide (TPR) repeat protein